MIARCKQFARTETVSGQAFRAIVVAWLVFGGVLATTAQPMPVRPEERPPEIQNVGLDEKLNTQVDPNLTFIDEAGQTVALKDYFGKGRPVVLNLVYYSCPMLCGMVLQGVVGSLKQVPYVPGQEIEVVTISFDPKETAALAAAKKASIMQDYARPGADKGWHVLVDKDGNAKKLADQVGFRFRWDDETKQFAHPSVTMILTPEGKLSRYLAGIDYPQRDMRLALAEASQGKIGTLSDRFMLYCYKYDPSSRSYTMAATNTMKAGGVLIMLILGFMLFFFWRREFSGQGGRRNVWEQTPLRWSRLLKSNRYEYPFAMGTFHAPAASHNAPNVDNLYGFIFWLCVVFFILVIGPGAWFVYKYRLKPGEAHKPTPRITHHLGLELTWSVIPLILCFVIAVWGFWDFMALGVAPADTEDIYVTGYKWGWRFEHRDGSKELNELHLPEGKKVKLILTSEDVIHSFFIPDFRVKTDLPPGRYTSLWFEPIGVGTHQVFCTEYCGDGHSGMLAKVIVMPKPDYEKWAKEGTGPEAGDSMTVFGQKLYAAKGCNTCHSVDGSKLAGPTFKGIFGNPQPLTTGSSVNVDEEFIRESILNPQAKIAAGYNPVMPSFQGVIKEKELQGLTEYIKSLK